MRQVAQGNAAALCELTKQASHPVHGRTRGRHWHAEQLFAPPPGQTPCTVRVQATMNPWRSLLQPNGHARKEGPLPIADGQNCYAISGHSVRWFFLHIAQHVRTPFER